MPNFKIEFVCPKTGEFKVVYESFESWSGYLKDADGNRFGHLMTVTAKDFASDYGYALADKGKYTVTRIPE